MKTNYVSKIVGAVMAACIALCLTSCGERVEVPPAHVGVVKTGDGIEKEIHQPSSFRLPHSWVVNNQLILVETSHFITKESITLYMPKDELNFTFDVRGTYAISIDDVPQIVQKVVANTSENDNILRIDSGKVYSVYVEQLIRTRVRSIISNYKITEVVSNLDSISDEIFAEVAKELEGSPIKPIRMGLAKVQPPKVVVDAHESNKRREIEIMEAENKKQIKLKEAEAAKEVAMKQQEVDLIEAETQVLVEKKLADAVSSAFVTQRCIKVLETMAASDNKVFLLPMEALSNPSVMVGVNTEALKPTVKQ